LERSALQEKRAAPWKYLYNGTGRDESVVGCASQLVTPRIEVIAMIVIYRNGVPTIISGWRAWLIMLAAAFIAVVVICLTLGFALTLMTLFLFGLPLAIVLGFVIQLFQSRR